MFTMQLRNGIGAMIIFVMVIFITGCISSTTTGYTQTTTPTVPAPTPQIVYVPATATPTSAVISSQNSIIGVWRIIDASGYDERFRFNADGTYLESLSPSPTSQTLNYYGTWSPQGSISYQLRNKVLGEVETYVYDPSMDDLYATTDPTQLLTRTGAM